MFELVFHSGDKSEERIPFTVSEKDLDDGMDYGMVEPAETLLGQSRQAAYYMVLDLRVCSDVEKLGGQPWILVTDGDIICQNAASP